MKVWREKDRLKLEAETVQDGRLLGEVKATLATWDRHEAEDPQSVIDRLDCHVSRENPLVLTLAIQGIEMVN